MATTTETQTLCINCGSLCTFPSNQLSADSQRRTAELEAQVRMLTDKASSAVDKLADYEDELRRLKLQQPPSQPPTGPLPIPPGPESNLQGRFTSLLTRRQSPSNSSSNGETRPQSSRRESDLQAALAREQDLRQKAEVQVTQMSGELEDLSQTLFEQANTMVATERMARAKLEERVAVLEKRDVEKRKRLERLEGALKRIERVRGLLAPPPP